MLVKDVDDLELVLCSVCGGRPKAGVKCFQCQNTGDLVIHRVKYFEVYPKQKRPKYPLKRRD